MTSFASINAIDPGGTTGISTIWYWPAALINPKVPIQRCMMAWEAACLFGNENEQALESLKWIANRTNDDDLNVVIEDFILQSAIKGRELLSPVRIGHKIDYQLWRGIKVATGKKLQAKPYWQSANDAKSVVTDVRLQEAAMYTPGPDHARDATRHGVLWLRRMRAELLKK